VIKDIFKRDGIENEERYLGEDSEEDDQVFLGVSQQHLVVVTQKKEGVDQGLIHEKVLSVILNSKDGEFNCGAFCHQLVTIPFSLTEVLGWWDVAVNFAGGIAWGGGFFQ
jgi:hypothetical protein